MKIEYLLFNVIVLFFSTLGCLLYKNRSWPKFSAASISITLISGLFIIWDQFVTGWWWKFNDAYTVGIKFGKLPIEEILFFLIIPWSCLVIWENLKKKSAKFINKKHRSGCYPRRVHYRNSWFV